jgi:hypothetical protein
MIPKKVAKSNNPKDYRPISMTSCLGKLAERLLRTRLYDYLNKNNLLIDKQSGFKNHKQTKDNFFHLIQKTTESFNREKKVRQHLTKGECRKVHQVINVRAGKIS